MNAVEFVRNFGWERSKKAVWMSITEFSRAFDVDLGFICCNRTELKKLVESYELVESWGGLEDAKLYDLSPYEKKPESAGFKLKKAIADIESVGGGV